MTQEERHLLLIDLCARLPYGVICRQDAISVDGEPFTINKHVSIIQLEKCISLDDVEVPFRPYLRPLTSMTEEEKREYEATCSDWYETLESYDWLNTHHFDYRGLINKGLALVAPDGMYDLSELGL